MDKILKIQTEIGTLSKDKKNPFFKSSYFDVNQIIEQLLPLLEKHEVSVVQPLTNIDGVPALKTIVWSGDKEVINETIVLPQLADSQKMGSAITYYRRYALQSLFLLQADDDDGNKAAKKAKVVKEVLTPKSDKWQTALDSVKGGKFTVEQIRSKYTLSDTDAKLLTQ